jgi:hypothetical protein
LRSQPSPTVSCPFLARATPNEIRTLVDLPGWIHTESKSQTKADITIVQSLIKEYIANERTILLAVVSAKNDYANQVILQKCRDIDEDGHRTLGIITKTDTLTTPTAHKTWINLAQNTDIKLKLGWHFVRNRADNEQDRSFDERNLEERTFFDSGLYKQLPKKMKGIVALQDKLSKLLFDHLKQELPKLEEELTKELKSVTSKLKTLGQRRGSPAEQRRFLTDMFVKPVTSLILAFVVLMKILSLDASMLMST